MTQMIQLTMAAEMMDDNTGESIESPMPLAVDPSQIQGFHPRKYGKVGTRLMMRGGRTLVVVDLYADVARMVGFALVAPTQTEEEDGANIAASVS